MEFPRCFFKRIFRDVFQDHRLDLEIRWLHQFPDKVTFRPVQFRCHSITHLEDHWPEIRRLNEIGYDIHFTVVARLPEVQGKRSTRSRTRLS
jgi:hypothetical protein